MSKAEIGWKLGFLFPYSKQVSQVVNAKDIENRIKTLVHM